MATPFTHTPRIGADLKGITLAADIAAGKVVDAQLGTQVWGSDGKRYVYAQAGASITASDADCAINTTTFVAAASGGSYTSPATDMENGDRGWFSIASV